MKNSDWAWQVREVNDEWFYYNWIGHPIGPYKTEDEALDARDFYSRCCDIDDGCE